MNLSVNATSTRLDPSIGLGKVTQLCGINSAVECQLPKLKVAGSNPVSRSKLQTVARQMLFTTGAVHRLFTTRPTYWNQVSEVMTPVTSS